MKPTRREFVAAAGATVAGCAFCVFGAGAAMAAPFQVKTGPVSVGNLSDFTADGIFDQFARSEQVVLIRRGGMLSACPAICTHKQAILKGVEGQLRCPTHGSRYAPDGSVVKGPAKQPLDHLAIAADASGNLTVDRSRRVDISDPSATVKAS